MKQVSTFSLALLILCTLFILIANVGIAHAIATDTYADLDITIANDGRSQVTGSSNVPIGDIPASDTINGFTDVLTTKRRTVWTFNLTTDALVNVSVVKVHMPAHVSINAIKSDQTSNIGSENGITITFVGKNEPLRIAIQYTFEPSNATTNPIASGSQSSFALYALASAAFIAIIGLVTVIMRSRKHRVSKSGVDLQKLSLLRPTLNETQNKIIDALIASGGTASQNKLHHATQIPKASLSRNVDLLAQKQILQKVSGGYTNQISFAPDLRKQ